MAKSKMSDVYDLFDEIRARPGMWVPDKSLATLETMAHAYSVALFIHDIDEAGADFNRRFREYLHRRFRWSMSCGWAVAIADRCATTDEAFARFFTLVEQFRRFETRANRSPPKRTKRVSGRRARAG